MENMSEHEALNLSLAAYALDALLPNEEAALREHLETCEECQHELQSFVEAERMLAASLEERLPAGFADQVLAKAREQGRPVTRKRELRRLLAPALAAALLLSLAASSITLVRLTTAENEIKTLRSALTKIGSARSSLELSGPNGQARLLTAEDEGVLLVSGLPEVPSGQTYQLWLIEDGKPMPADTFDVTQDLTVVEVQLPATGDFQGAAVTIEPSGGSQEPDLDRLVLQSA